MIHFHRRIHDQENHYVLQQNNFEKRLINYKNIFNNFFSFLIKN